MPEVSEEELFAQASELPTEERAAFLEEACGDDAALKAGVEELLVGHETFSDLLDVPLEEREEELSEVLSEAKDTLTVNEPNPVPDEMVLGNFGDYIIEKELARGAMGVVYRAEHTRLKRTVALKMIRATMLANEEEVARFKAESEAAASLDHPNIVPIYEVGEHEEQHFFTMKLIEGGTLSDRIGAMRETPEEAAKLMEKVSRAIHAAHQRGILHRDIKPGNILIDEAGEPHVTDFGLAKQMESNSSMTLSGQIMGTPYYMAPEQAKGGGKQVSTAADIYSLGAVLYELLTGERPHQGESLMDTLKQVIEEEPAAPRTADPSIDRDLETIVLKCLEKDPDKRYPSAAGLAADLDRWLAGETILARPVGSVEKVVKWMRRKPVLASLWGLVAVFLLTLSIGGPMLAYTQAELRKEAELQRNKVLDEQMRTEEQRMKADDARRVAQAATKMEAQARREAEKYARENRRNLYLAEMNLASQAATESGGVRRFRELLDRWLPVEGEEDLRGWEWHYLNTLARRERLSFGKHRKQVRAVSWGPRGDRILSGDLWGTIHAWHPETGDELFTFSGKRTSTEELAWSPDGNRFVSGGRDGTLRFHDGTTGEILSQWPRREAELTAVNWSPDGIRLASAWKDGTILVGDADGGAEPLTIEAHARNFSSLAWSPDGGWLASGGHNQLRVWDANSGERIRDMPETGLVNSIAWSPNGRWFAASNSEENRIVVHDATTFDVLLTLEGHDELVEELAWSPDSRRLASASWDHTARIWDIATGKLWATLRGIDKVTSISWSLDGRQVVAGIGKGAIVFDATGEDTRTLRGHEGALSAVNWSPGSDRLVSASSNGTVRIWNVGNDTLENEFRGHARNVGDAAWSPGGERVASIGVEGKILVWNAGTGKVIHSLEGHQGQGRDVSWSPDGTRFASLGDDWMLRVWDGEIGEELAAIELVPHKEFRPAEMAWSPDGKWLAALNHRSTIVIWNAETFEEARRIEISRPGFTCLALSPRGDRFALGLHDGGIQILDAGGGEGQVLELAGHNSRIESLAWSPDGTRLVSGGVDRSLRVWDAATGAQCLLLRGHEGAVTAVDWSADGSRIASGSRDRTIKIWGIEVRDP